MTIETITKIRPEKRDINPGWSNLKPAKKGEVRNPKGRPKKELSITSKVKELLEHEVTAIAQRVVDELKKPVGKYPTGLFCEVLNRTEGRVPGDLSAGFNPNVQVIIVSEIPRSSRVEVAKVENQKLIIEGEVIEDRIESSKRQEG